MQLSIDISGIVILRMNTTDSRPVGIREERETVNYLCYLAGVITIYASSVYKRIPADNSTHPSLT